MNTTEKLEKIIFCIKLLIKTLKEDLEPLTKQNIIDTLEEILKINE